ncbi:MAG TPA: BON domain-containing protein [Isosphaeraceae bacterium]|nr:BON domain-containing protein [Isosphaeraceae bacterium]
MRGTVADTAAKAKAELLARETVGVTQVVNLLTLSPPTSETAPASSRTGSSLKP